MARAKKSVKCQLCGGTTQLGYTLDQGQGPVMYQDRWAPGEARPSFWHHKGRIKKPTDIMIVDAYRCTKCGYLMHFANPEESA